MFRTPTAFRLSPNSARGVFGPAANVVNALRIGGVQQVQIEVTVARVNRSRARQIGFSFLQSGVQHFVASTVGGGGSLTTAATLPSVLSPATSLASTPNAVFGIFNNKEAFFGYLQALTTEGLAKLITEPRVITLSGRPAWIVSGGETPILTTSGTGAPSVTYKTFGTIVNFLPIVLGNGKIHLEVRPEISALNQAAGISITSAGGTTTVPGFDVRSAQVAVQMEDGQTLAIGGMIQNTVNAQNTKVPILGDIPIIQAAFSSKTYTESEEELIILVTPHLIDPMACCQLPKYLPGRETRSADDFELFLEGILEAPRGQRNLTHPYTAAYLNGPTAEKFPCGDTSGSGRCGPRGCTTGNCANGNCASGNCAGGACGNGTTGQGVVSGVVRPAPRMMSQQIAPERGDLGSSLETIIETPNTVPQIREIMPTTPAVVPASEVTMEMRIPQTPAVFGPAILTEPR